MMQKESNILDPVQDTLDQDVFNGTVPKKEFFDYHLDHIREVFRQNGFNPHAFDFYLTGSLCTYQYSDKSDVDISIICNVDEFSEEDRSDLIAIVLESLDGEFFPRTRHQYQHFVQPVGVDIEDLFILGMRSAWDFQKDKWVLKPKRAYAHNIQKENPDWILAGVQVSDKINTLIDYHQYDKAREMYKELHRRRKEDQIEYGDYSEGNIIYKFLDNNGTFDRLRNIGQKIALNKQSVFEDFVNDYSEGLVQSMIKNPPTHLNPRGVPCNCSFGKPDASSIRKYYDLSVNSEFEKSSKVDFILEENEEDKRESIVSLYKQVIEKELDPNTKWSKRFPEQREELVELFNDKDSYTSLLISPKNIKYLTGAVQLLKENIRKENIENNIDTFYSNMIIPFGLTRNRIDTRRKEKIKHQFQEAYRFFATNNFGKGIDNFSIQKLKRRYQDILPYIQYMEDIQIDDNYANLVAKETSRFLDNLDETDNNIITNAYQERPEITFNKLLNSLDITTKANFESLARTMDKIRIGDIQRVVKEYNIPFPTNLKSFGDWNEINMEISRILELIREREEYKKILRDFKPEDYIDHDPIYTVEFKKGNPEKAMPGKWGVYEVRYIEDMEKEGELMRHCMGDENYYPFRRRNQGMNKVYSVRDPNGVPVASLEMSNDGKYVAEARARHNQHLTPVAKRILNGFFGQESFQRESDDPDRYIIRMANGEEKEYRADNLDKALEEHNSWLNSWLVTKEEKKEYKAVAGYGAGHDWFSIDEESRTGTNWGNELDPPEGAIEELEQTYDEYYDIPIFDIDGDVRDWIETVSRYVPNVLLTNLLEGFTTDPQEGYDPGVEYVYIVSGMLSDLPESQELIELINKNYNDDTLNLDLSDEDARSNFLYQYDHDWRIESLGVIFSVMKVLPETQKKLKYVNFYLDKQINSLKNDSIPEMTYYILVKGMLNQLNQPRYIDDILPSIESVDLDSLIETKQGSYAYYNYFGDSLYNKNFDVNSYNPNVEQINPQEDNKVELREDDDVENIIKDIKQIINFGNGLKQQIEEMKMLPFDESNRFLMINKKKTEEHKRWNPDIKVMKIIPTFTSDLKYFYDVASRTCDQLLISKNTLDTLLRNLEGLAYINNYQHMISYMKSLVDNYNLQLEYKAHQLYNDSLVPMQGQINFFDMPPEPTESEYANWAAYKEIADGGISDKNNPISKTPTIESVPFERAFING